MDNQQTTNKNTLPKRSPEERLKLYKPIIEKCRDYITNFILNSVSKKIDYYINVMKYSYGTIFRFNGEFPKVDVEYKFNTYIVYDTKTDKFNFSKMRPKTHPQHIWYFSLFYIITGYSKVEWKSYKSLGLKTVIDSIKEAYEVEGYTVHMKKKEFKNNNSYNIIISWSSMTDEQKESQSNRLVRFKKQDNKVSSLPNEEHNSYVPPTYE